MRESLRYLYVVPRATVRTTADPLPISRQTSAMGRKKKRKGNNNNTAVVVVDTSTAHIAIVGGGLAGLATALALERCSDFHGTVHVYEQDAGLRSRREGYGLTLSYRPGGVLDKLGILDALAAADCPSRSHYLLRSDGRPLGYFGNAFSKTRGCGQRGNLRVPRQRLREMLYQRLNSTTVHWNHRFVDFQEIVTAEGRAELALEFVDQATNTVTQCTADILVAADGVRSAVTKTVPFKDIPAPKPLGIRLILGLTEASIPASMLLNEQGFYTVDQGIRLFVMPYTGSSRGQSLNENEPVRYMWQLSFVDAELRRVSSDELRAEALRRTEGWHDPVRWLVDNTATSSIWGTALYDRDPTPFLRVKSRNVLFAGDALHAMSPFKGQGANQSLQDAVTIASWLTRPGTTTARVACCQQELVQRTAKVVRASRAAAQYVHSVEFLCSDHPWAGIVDTSRLMEILQGDRTISAASSRNLDTAINEIVDNNQIARSSDTAGMSRAADRDDDDDDIQIAMINAARTGDVGMLRRLSWKNPTSTTTCSSIAGNSLLCLKAAATESGDLATIHWLFTEGGCTTSEWKEWKLASIEVERLLRRLDRCHCEAMATRSKEMSIPLLSRW